MILVDTSVWIDHLHRSDRMLVDLLLADEVCIHPLVIEEVALGSIARRDDVLATLAGLQSVAAVSHDRVLSVVTEHELWGKGLSAVDAHLLGSVLRSEDGVRLWTRDKKLAAAAEELGVGYAP
jgi:predicted nucleic acid-binding protein